METLAAFNKVQTGAKIAKAFVLKTSKVLRSLFKTAFWGMLVFGAGVVVMHIIYLTEKDKDQGKTASHYFTPKDLNNN